MIQGPSQHIHNHPLPRLKFNFCESGFCCTCGILCLAQLNVRNKWFFMVTFFVGEVVVRQIFVFFVFIVEWQDAHVSKNVSPNA